jgi:hypothetical protein
VKAGDSWTEMQNSEFLQQNRAILRVVNKIQLFQRLDLARKESLIRKLQPRLYLGGEVVFNQGDVGDCLYIIVAGKVKV